MGPNRSFGTIITANRSPNQELSGDTRSAILSKLEEGVSQRQCAALFRVSRTAVQDTLKRWETHKTLQSLPRAGRPPVLEVREVRSVVRTIRKEPKIEYQKLIEDTGLASPTPTHRTPPHRSTIYRLLRKRGLINHRCAKRPLLLKSHAILRLKFAITHRHFNWRRRTVKFSDECSVQRGSGRQAEWCFRYAHEKYDPKMITPQEKGKRMSQMVWGAIWVTSNGRVGRSPLIIMERDFESKKHGYSGASYVNTLERGLQAQYRPGDIFVQDNAPIHVCKEVQKWLETHGIWTLEWPPYSPDLNPIEHIWWALKKYVHKLHPELDQMGVGKEDWKALRTALKAAWKAIPNSLIRKLIESMPRRLAAARKAKGWQTKY